MSPRIHLRQLYRVEHREPMYEWPWRAVGEHYGVVGPGPYTEPSRVGDLRADLMKTPSGDGLSINPEQFCAVRSADDVRHWFGPDADRLHQANYLVRTYWVPALFVQDGGEQSVFDGEVAELSGEHSLEDLHTLN